MLGEIIRHAVAAGADQVHLVANAKPMIRYKTKIQVSDFDILLASDIDQMLKSFESDLPYDQLLQYGEANFGYALSNLGRFRVNVIRQRGSYAISIRIHKLTLPEKETLKIPEKAFELIHGGRGLFLVAGPAGSGKSTTIATLIHTILKTEPVHVITVESPIEYLLKHDLGLVLQRDVGIDCKDVYSGLKGAALHDPDVVVVSEITDDATLSLALQIAESGKRVIAGYSARNALTAIERMMVTENAQEQLRKYQISSALTGILAQQLIVTNEGKEIVMVPELLIVNGAIQTHIHNNQLSEIQNSLISGRKQGMISMDASLVELYQKGMIDYDAVIQNSMDHDFVKRLMAFKRGD